LPRFIEGAPGDVQVLQNEDIMKGGNTIEYHDEDPYIRKMFKDALEKNGGKFGMPESIYDKIGTPLQRGAPTVVGP
jgi:hypothetical protein